MESKCEGCGADIDCEEGYWKCGSHNLRGFFYQSDLCEATARIATLTADLAAAKKEVERLKAENEQLRRGAPLGPIIGAQTILEQEIELKKLRKQVKLPHPELAYKAVMARSEQLKEEPKDA